MMEKVLAFLLPRHCLLCGCASGPSNLCAPCRQELPAYPSANEGVGALIDRAVSALHYRSPVDYLVCHFKFNGSLACGQVLADQLGLYIEQLGVELPDYLVPVPLHGTRQFQRKFNQADIIARRLGQKFKIPVLSRLLIRRRNTVAQSRLDAASRHQNMNGAFALRRSRRKLVNRRIALIDDVFTTGATLSQCARPLASSHAAEISAWTVARADPPGLPAKPAISSRLR